MTPYRLILATLILSGTVGYSETKPDRDIRRMGDIHTIENATDFELILTDRGIEGTLIAQGRKVGLESLVTVAENGVLKISQSAPKNHLPKLPFFNATLTVQDPVKIVISCPKLKKYSTTGSGSTVLVSQRFQNLQLEVEGAGVVHLSKCRMYSLEAKVQGTGKIIFENSETVDGKLHLEGTGEIHAHDLRSKNISAEIYGEGKITTWAREFLTGKVIGKGTLEYRDNPSSLRQQIEQGGKIDRYFPDSTK
jgi:hypothetical protein